MPEIDARGKPCPQPVLLVKQKADAGEERFAVLVDNRAAVENVKRYGEKSGYSTAVEELEGHWRITGEKTAVAQTGDDAQPRMSAAQQGSGKPSPVLILMSETLGRDNEELGRMLTNIFISTLAVNKAQPRKIVLMNAGVKLACEGSAVLEAMGDIEKKGVEILACGTCLNFYKLNHSLRVGRTADAYEIVNIMLENTSLILG
ncbi:MAG: sulfurtransferase-like selenium metabolism protein YedF [Bacillota bacterium]